MPRKGTSTIAKRLVIARGMILVTQSTRHRINTAMAFRPPALNPSGADRTRYDAVEQNSHGNKEYRPPDLQ